MTVKLSEIFVKESNKFIYAKNELASLDIKKEFIKRLEQHFEIPFVSEVDSGNGNLCFANNDNIRFTYKSVFSKKDIRAFLFASLNKGTFHLNTTEVIFT